MGMQFKEHAVSMVYHKNFSSPSGKVTVTVLLVSNSNELCFGFDFANSTIIKEFVAKNMLGDFLHWVFLVLVLLVSYFDFDHLPFEV